MEPRLWLIQRVSRSVRVVAVVVGRARASMNIQRMHFGISKLNREPRTKKRCCRENTSSKPPPSSARGNNVSLATRSVLFKGSRRCRWKQHPLLCEPAGLTKRGRHAGAAGARMPEGGTCWLVCIYLSCCILIATRDGWCIGRSLPQTALRFNSSDEYYAALRISGNTPGMYFCAADARARQPCESQSQRDHNDDNIRYHRHI